jgi:hypothetical protein
MSLSLKGLVELEQSDGFTKQQTLVRAKNPSTLREIIAQRRLRMSNLEADILSVMPQLKDSFQKQQPNADFQFMPGIEGVKQIYLYHLADVDLPEYTWDKLLPADIFGTQDMDKSIDTAISAQKQAKRRSKDLIPLNDWTRHVISYQYKRNPAYLQYRELRYIDSPGFDLFLKIAIKGQHVRIACAEGDEAWGMATRSDALAKSLVAIHQLLWLTAQPITTEMVESWGDTYLLVRT